MQRAVEGSWRLTFSASSTQNSALVAAAVRQARRTLPCLTGLALMAAACASCASFMELRLAAANAALREMQVSLQLAAAKAELAQLQSRLQAAGLDRRLSGPQNPSNTSRASVSGGHGSADDVATSGHKSAARDNATSGPKAAHDVAKSGHSTADQAATSGHEAAREAVDHAGHATTRSRSHAAAVASDDSDAAIKKMRVELEEENFGNVAKENEYVGGKVELPEIGVEDLITEEDKLAETGEADHLHFLPAPVDLAISYMLLGSVCFVMALFYLVHHSDTDIQYYSWSVISSTIAIFTSLLIFVSIEEVVTYCSNHYFKVSYSTHVLIDYVHMLFWMMLLMYVVTLISGATKLTPECMQGEQHLQMKCWARLLSHIAGFASTHAGCELQHMELKLASDAGLPFLLVAAHMLLLFILIFLLDVVRKTAIRKMPPPDDVDEIEEKFKLLEESNEEGEHEIAAISLSFLFVQALRYLISGIMPNCEGAEEPQKVHSLSCTLYLALAALTFAALTILFPVLMSRMPWLEQQYQIHRVLEIVRGTCTMSFAWCFYFSSKWQMKRAKEQWDPNEMMPRLILALFVTVIGISLTFVLDYLHDLELGARTVERALRSLILSLGVLVGFAWEQSFEGAIAVVAVVTGNPLRGKLITALLVTLLMIPAWRNHILFNCELAKYHHEMHLNCDADSELPMGEAASLSQKINNPALQKFTNPGRKVEAGIPSRHRRMRAVTQASSALTGRASTVFTGRTGKTSTYNMSPRASQNSERSMFGNSPSLRDAARVSSRPMTADQDRTGSRKLADASRLGAYTLIATEDSDKI